MDQNPVFEALALKQLIIWLAAREVSRSSDINVALAEMSDELHLLTDTTIPPVPAFQPMLDEVGAQLDLLIQAVAHEARRSSDVPGRP